MMPALRTPNREGPSMDQQSIHLLMLAAGRYAGSRSPQDRAAMLSVGSECWDDFPVFLLQMKRALKAGRAGELLRQDNAKHMYALLFVSILHGLDAAYLDKVGGALLAAAMPPRRRVPRETPTGAGGRPHRLAQTVMEG